MKLKPWDIPDHAFANGRSADQIKHDSNRSTLAAVLARVDRAERRIVEMTNSRPIDRATHLT